MPITPFTLVATTTPDDWTAVADTKVVDVHNFDLVKYIRSTADAQEQWFTTDIAIPGDVSDGDATINMTVCVHSWCKSEGQGCYDYGAYEVAVGLGADSQAIGSHYSHQNWQMQTDCTSIPPGDPHDRDRHWTWNKLAALKVGIIDFRSSMPGAVVENTDCTLLSGYLSYGSDYVAPCFRCCCCCLCDTPVISANASAIVVNIPLICDTGPRIWETPAFCIAIPNVDPDTLVPGCSFFTGEADILIGDPIIISGYTAGPDCPDPDAMNGTYQWGIRVGMHAGNVAASPGVCSAVVFAIGVGKLDPMTGDYINVFSINGTFAPSLDACDPYHQSHADMADVSLADGGGPLTPGTGYLVSVSGRIDISCGGC